MPDEVLELMQLYPQPTRAQSGGGGVEYLPVPRQKEAVPRERLGDRGRSTREVAMKLKEEFAAARTGWKLMTLYQKFEHAVILVLTALIAIVVAFAVWNLRSRS